MKNKSLFYFGSGAFAVCVLALLFGFTQKSQSTQEDVHGEYITIMTTEVYSDHSKSEIEISYGDNKIEHRELKKYHKENRDYNLNQVTDILNELHSKGYDVITNSIAVTNHHKVTLFIMEKHRN